MELDVKVMEYKMGNIRYPWLSFGIDVPKSGVIERKKATAFTVKASFDVAQGHHPPSTQTRLEVFGSAKIAKFVCILEFTVIFSSLRALTVHH